jgi:hypothetical protein
MKIQVTLNEIMAQGNWEEFCDKRGWDYYIVNEGKADGEETVLLESEEAIRYGFIL